MTGLTIVEPWLWTAFLVGIVVALLLDLFVLHRGNKPQTLKHALLISAFWIGIALAFNAWFAFEYGTNLGLEMLTGYVVEKSLSIDNVFVILLIFRSFKIPMHLQHRALFWGIFGAIFMRAALIIVGAGLIHRFHWILYVFGVILIISGLKFLFGSEEEQEFNDHWMVRGVRRFIPITNRLHEHHFMVVEDGKRKATPLLLCIAVIEATDLVFAVDSIPAVLAITQDSFVAFSSNILAVLGLRALYFVIADAVSRFRYLKPGLAAILCFVGVKMLVAEWFKVPSWVSLLVITMILVTAGLSSWYVTRKEESVFNDQAAKSKPRTTKKATAGHAKKKGKGKGKGKNPKRRT